MSEREETEAYAAHAFRETCRMREELHAVYERAARLERALQEICNYVTQDPAPLWEIAERALKPMRPTGFGGGDDAATDAFRKLTEERVAKRSMRPIDYRCDKCLNGGPCGSRLGFGQCDPPKPDDKRRHPDHCDFPGCTSPPLWSDVWLGEVQHRCDKHHCYNPDSEKQ